MALSAQISLAVLLAASAPAADFPNVGERFGFLASAPTQDPYRCGDAVLDAARAVRAARGQGSFPIPVNCPVLKWRWPLEERAGANGEALIVDTLDADNVVLRIATPQRSKPTPKPARVHAGAPVHLIDVGRTP